MTARKAQSRRDRLAAARWRSRWFPVPLGDPEEVEAALRRLAAARSWVDVSEDEHLADAKAKVEEAKTALDGLVEWLEIRPLKSDADVDALMNAHPATEQQKQTAKDAGLPEPAMDVDGWNFALFLGSVVGADDMTEQEWRDMLEGWPRPERLNLYEMVREANTQTSYTAIPKD